ncbi:MAG: hypothetical protein ABJQ93_00420 [Luteolibacter sp.]
MLRLVPALILAAAFASASPYGISVPPGEKATLTAQIPAVRYFPSWETLQPSPGKWNTQPADDLIAAAKKSGTQVFGILHQPSGADAKPLIDDKEAWRTYVATLASRYAKDLTHWEVLPSYPVTDRTPDGPYHYAQLLTIARETAKVANPDAHIGFSIPNYDLEFFDRALRDGAEGQFDYISIASFPVAEDTDSLFLSILPRLRNILADYGMNQEMPIHLSLTGSPNAAEYYAQLAAENGYARVFLPSEGMFPSNPDKLEIPVKNTTSAETVATTLGEKNSYDGLYLLNPSSMPYDTELKATRLPITAQPPVTRAAFFAPEFEIGKNLEITVTAKRLPSETGTEHPTGFAITYESIHGIRNHETWWTVPGGDGWQTHTWTISDADFTGKYAWNFRLDASGAGNDLLIRSVSVTK